VALRTYERVMTLVADKTDGIYEDLMAARLERLPYLLCKFLQTAKKASGEVYSSGSLHTMFNGLCNALGGRGITVKGDARFNKVTEMLRVQTARSTTEGRGAGCNAKDALTPEHLRIALSAGTIGRNTPKALLTSVHMAAVVGWGCRPGNECHMIENGDLVFGPLDEKTQVPAWVGLSERLTKTRKGNVGDKRELTPRIFPDDMFPDTCYVRTIVAYMQRKTTAQKQPQAPFFLNVLAAAEKKPQQHEKWYVGTGARRSGICGINTLQSLLSDALEAAGIDCKAEKYSAMSMRKALLQTGVDCNVPDLHLSRLAGHKNSFSKSAYVKSAGLHHKTAARVIQRKLFQGEDDGYARGMATVASEDVQKQGGSRDEQQGDSIVKESERSGGAEEQSERRSRSHEKDPQKWRGRSRSRSPHRCELTQQRALFYSANQAREEAE
jgi:hypothetical protein